MSAKRSGLGKGLDSLIPKKVIQTPLPKFSPVIKGVLEESIVHLSVGEIRPNPAQPRKDFDLQGLEDLADSIKVYGIIQPLIVTQVDPEQSRGVDPFDKLRVNKGYQIIAGERRWRAAKMANLRAVPCIVRNVARHEQLELSLIENIQRKNLNPIEEAVAYRRLLDEFNFTHDELAKRVGKSRPVITNALRLLNLPEEIQRAIIDGKLHFTIGRILAGMKTEDQRRYFKRALQEKFPTHALEIHAKREKSPTVVKTYKRRGKDPNIIAKEEELQEIFGTSVTIYKNGEVGRITIQFYSEEEFSALLEKLKQV